jgi:hypothetical protein
VDRVCDAGFDGHGVCGVVCDFLCDFVFRNPIIVPENDF